MSLLHETLVLALAVAAPVPAVELDRIGHLELLGETVVPSAWAGDRSPIGGLSALVRDAARDVYYALPDDRAEHGPVRFYTLTIDLSDGALDDGDVAVVGQTELRLEDGAPFGRGRVDPEGLAILPSGELLVSSEGVVRAELPPFVRVFGRDGTARRAVPLAPRYRTRRDAQAGVRDNLGFESLTVSPSGRLAFTATESALIEDAPAPSHERPSPARLLVIDLASTSVVAEHVYLVEPLWVPDDGERLNVSGLVELLAIDDHRLLAMERAFVMGRGNRVRLFEIDLSAASDVAARASVAGATPVTKRLLLDVGMTGVRPDNLEGLTFGPVLPDGRPSVLLLADDNFAPHRQRSQLIAYAVGSKVPSVPEIQGAGHRSPWESSWVRGVTGTVTGLRRSREGAPEGFWIQAAPDGDPGSADGVYVEWPHEVAVGGEARVDAGVRERERDGELSVTWLAAAAVETTAGGELPPPLRVTTIPPVIDDDGLTLFQPEHDAIDFFESLEGMRVALADASVVGPTRSFGELAVVLAGAPPDGAKSARGGVLASPSDEHPEIWLVGASRAWPAPQLPVGARFTTPLVGVVDYGFGAYRLEVDEWPQAEAPPIAPPAPWPADERLTVATYNVLNLDPTDPPTKFDLLAEQVVGPLGAPDLVALQEVQDDDGAVESDVVGAARTLSLLTEAITRAGGPAYAVRQIDPDPGADGGEPGGNIRVALLIRPERVRPVDRGEPGPRVEAAWIAPQGRPALSVSPARVAPLDPAFAGDPARAWTGSRKCLAQELEHAGRPLFVVNCHLSSKGGDDRLFGSRQPPRRVTETRRVAQAERLASFARELLSLDDDARLIVLGDLNENEFREPIRRLESVGLVNLVHAVPADELYTFNYRGLSQVLDHVLVTPALAEGAEVRILHLNSDLPESRRASDHDPLVVRLAGARDAREPQR